MESNVVGAARMRAIQAYRKAEHERAADTEKMLAVCDRGLIADDLTGPVGDAAWEAATAGADSHWSLLP